MEAQAYSLDVQEPMRFVFAFQAGLVKLLFMFAAQCLAYANKSHHIEVKLSDYTNYQTTLVKESGVQEVSMLLNIINPQK